MAAFVLQANKKTTVSGAFAAGATSLTLASAAFTNFTDGYLVVDYDVDSKFEIIKCSVTGTAVTSITRGQDGTSDVAHASGAKIGFNFVPAHYAALVDGTGVSTTVLGYAETNTSQAGISTVADLTGLSAAVTVPAGGKRIKVTGYVPFAQQTSSGTVKVMIWEGAAQLQAWVFDAATSNSNTGLAEYVAVPSAGAHTYKLRMSTSANTVNTVVAADQLAFILVELL